jgi:hypothetical protein
MHVCGVHRIRSGASPSRMSCHAFRRLCWTSSINNVLGPLRPTTASMRMVTPCSKVCVQTTRNEFRSPNYCFYNNIHVCYKNIRARMMSRSTLLSAKMNIHSKQQILSSVVL